MSDDSPTADEDRPDATRVFSTVFDESAPPAQTSPSAPAAPTQRSRLRLDPRRPWTPGTVWLPTAGPVRSSIWSTRFGRKVWVVVGVVITVVVISVIATERLTSPTTLDRAAAQDEVRGILVNNYNLTEVGEIHCPDEVRVNRGATFTCIARIDGVDKQIVAEFTDSGGTYKVGQPG